MTATISGRLAIFFLIAFGWSWLFWFIAQDDSTGPGLAAVLRIIATFGPLVAASTVVAVTRGARGLSGWLCATFRPNAPVRYYVLGIVGPPLLMSIACLLHLALGGTLGPVPVVRHWWTVPLNFMLIFLFGGPLGEEPGWRGFALPLMQKAMAPPSAAAILGAIWGIWHLPLFFMSGTVQSQLPYWLFLLNAIPASMVLCWLFDKTGGNVVPPMVLHMGINGWAFFIPVLPAGTSIRPFAIATALLWGAALACVFDGRATTRGPDGTTDWP